MFLIFVIVLVFENGRSTVLIEFNFKLAELNFKLVNQKCNFRKLVIPMFLHGFGCNKGCNKPLTRVCFY